MAGRRMLMWRDPGWWMRRCRLRHGDPDRAGRTTTVTRVIGTGTRRSLLLPSFMVNPREIQAVLYHSHGLPTRKRSKVLAQVRFETRPVVSG